MVKHKGNRMDGATQRESNGWIDTNVIEWMRNTKGTEWMEKRKGNRMDVKTQRDGEDGETQR